MWDWMEERRRRRLTFFIAERVLAVGLAHQVWGLLEWSWKELRGGVRMNGGEEATTSRLIHCEESVGGEGHREIDGKLSSRSLKQN